MEAASSAVSDTVVAHGRIVDLDSHLMPLPEVFTEVLGERHGSGLRQWATGFVGGLSHEQLVAARGRARDDVWRVRGWLAHGADDPIDRVDALDQMGIARQLVFPPVTLPALHADGADAAIARRRYNDYAVEWASTSGGRLRTVAQLGTRDIGETIGEARRVVARGARAVELPFARPPGGRSPAAPEWDSLWAVLAEACVPVLLHVGGGGYGAVFGETRSFVDVAWGDGDGLRDVERSGAVDPTSVGDLGTFGPFDLALLHFGAEVFLTAVVLGGVLERHPNLRVGVIEVGCQWVSSWVERLDGIAAGHRLRSPGANHLAERPSDYIRRQVRVTPTYGEPVGSYIARDGLDEVYAFSTDFPHGEGGKDPIGRFYASVAPLGPDAVERFFVTNGEELMPA